MIKKKFLFKNFIALRTKIIVLCYLNAKPLYCEGKLGDYLQSSASIEEQIEILVASVCPESTDPVRCEEAARMYWSEIGKSK